MIIRTLFLSLLLAVPAAAQIGSTFQSLQEQQPRDDSPTELRVTVPLGSSLRDPPRAPDGQAPMPSLLDSRPFRLDSPIEPQPGSGPQRTNR